MAWCITRVKFFSFVIRNLLSFWVPNLYYKYLFTYLFIYFITTKHVVDISEFPTYGTTVCIYICVCVCVCDLWKLLLYITLAIFIYWLFISFFCWTDMYQHYQSTQGKLIYKVLFLQVGLPHYTRLKYV